MPRKKGEGYSPTLIEGFGETHCSVCNRALKDPVSRARGIGPVCLRKINARAEKHGNAEVDPWDPETMNVTFRRKKDLGITNVHQIHVHHSPTGMEWGYAGSGAADLALNILARFLPMSKAGVMGHKRNRVKLYGGSEVSGRVYELHQDFKFAFITPMAYSGGTILGSTIREWLISKGCPATEIAGSTQTEML